MPYIPTIGLEIHAELKTQSKMFCPCRNDPDEDRPNTNVCPICLGHPGTLPILNKEAVRHVLRIGTAINGKIADFTEWDRKNYFYPDIPKGYQISQYKYPLVEGGELCGVALERIHLEEDTARSTHDSHENSLVDFNRSGLPLMELVTRPVIHDAATAVAFARELQLLLRCLGAGDANMEKGEMRVEANISIASQEDTAAGRYGTKTEVKNLNSFRSVEGAIAHELARQEAVLASGGKIVQETRGWDDSAAETYSQRAKESSHDYRYFPDPDIPKLRISEIAEFSRDNLAAGLPELPWVLRERLKKDYAMTDKEVAVFVESRPLTDYFMSVVSGWSKSDERKIRLAINYILTDYLGTLRKEAARADQRPVDVIAPQAFAEIIDMIAAGELSSASAKSIIAIMVAEASSAQSDIGVGAQANAQSDAQSGAHIAASPRTSPRTIATARGLIQKNDVGEIAPIIAKVVADNAKAAAEYRGGKTASLQFLIGQAMKASRGSGNPDLVKKLLIAELNKSA